MSYSTRVVAAGLTIRLFQSRAEAEAVGTVWPDKTVYEVVQVKLGFILRIYGALAAFYTDAQGHIPNEAAQALIEEFVKCSTIPPSSNN